MYICINICIYTVLYCTVYFYITGNGEVFYGQRKYKPSGRKNTEGKYNGMGLTDSNKIKVAQMKRKEYLEEKRIQLIQQEQNWERQHQQQKFLQQEETWGDE